MSSIHPAADTIGVGKNERGIRYPALRQFGVTANNYGYSDFNARLNGANFAKGKIKTQRISSYFNTPTVYWNESSLSATVFYTYTSLKLKETTGPIAAQTTDKSTFDLALNYSRSDKIFNRQVIYSLVGRAISDDLNSIRRFNLNGSITLPIRKNENTSFSLGLLAVIDPSSPLPIEPIVNYYHKFIHTGFELLVDLPNGANLKKAVAKNAWVSIGSNQTSYSLFYDYHNAYLDGKLSYNTIELKSGAAFEYLFAKNFMVSIGGGINSFLASRVFREGERYNSASIRSSNKNSPYINVGLSLLTF